MPSKKERGEGRGDGKERKGHSSRMEQIKWEGRGAAAGGAARRSRSLLCCLMPS